MTAYDRLLARFEKIAVIGEARSMLGWDAAAMMPPGGGAARADQLAVLAGLAHAQMTAPEMQADLAAAEAPADPWQDEAHAAAHGGLWRIAYTPRSALPLAALLGYRAART